MLIKKISSVIKINKIRNVDESIIEIIKILKNGEIIDPDDIKQNIQEVLKK